ncbi:ABC transporter permease [Falsigemmobacter intermedius]|uniref:ABC transporter permease n=1 Tax=Falsigemmobacter intermedius TaxID=1553448 RepID=A0A444MBP2_9RHOB|nr:ABC transporter permease [Falsigemmobacter intermedius]RWY41409.1 ABC transporter permease [Falsigemmobacter intermedius]
MSRMLSPLALFLLLFAVWEGYCRLSGVSELVLPGPLAVLHALYIHRDAIGVHALATVLVALPGFALSVSFAVLTSMLLHACPRAERAVLPVFVASQTIPLVALAPLMILWFGFGLLPKILLVILVTFLPVLLSLLSGYRQTPAAFTELLQSMGAGGFEIFRRATWPSARPAFFAGLRISATYAIVATIFAEYAGARQGIGIWILSAKNSFRADLVLAGVVVSALLTLTLLAVLRGIEVLTRPGRGGRGHA